jgi:YbbR domain-containing protein
MKERHFHIAIFSAVFAILLWISIALTSEYQTTVSIGLDVENLKPGRALARPLPSSVSLKLRGSGWQLVRLSSVPDSRYEIDLSDILYRKRIITREEYQDRLRLPAGVQVIEIRPETLLVVLDEKIRRTVPVSVNGDFTFREGYGIVGGMQTTPDSVVLTGAQSLLNSIESWNTVPLRFTNLKSGVTTRADLSDSLSFGVTAVPTTVQVRFDVQPIAEKALQGIAVEVNHLPDDRTVVLIPPKIDIVIRGGVNQIAAVNMKDFKAYIDFKTILLDTTGMLKPSIVGPRDIRVVGISPERTQYVVRK